jgi:hypothetical protein
MPPSSEGSPLEAPNMEERNELRHQARTWGLIPGIAGVLMAITLALLFLAAIGSTASTETECAHSCAP